MAKKAKGWSFSAGARGSSATVYEREPGGVLYARAYDSSLAGGQGGYRCMSLRHDDRQRATTYSLEQSAKLRKGESELLAGKVTLGRVMAQYLIHQSPKKQAKGRKDDERCAEMWCRFLGASKDPHLISLGEWEQFIRLRLTGAIDARGRPVAPEKRRPVRNRAVEIDCDWLRWALAWGARWRESNGRYLLRESAVRGYDAPTEANPRRPVATTDRYEALRAVSDQVMMEVVWAGERRQRSYLSEVLDLVQSTGRRIAAIAALRYEDLQLDAKPYGAIRWPADTDKQGREMTAPLSPLGRGAIDRALRDRPGIGAGYIFPKPGDASSPVDVGRIRRWMLAAEAMAGVAKQKGTMFHGYRRGWVTSRKHLPGADVAAAGGWKGKATMEQCYSQPDEATMLAVVLGGVELRGRKAQ